MELYKDGYDTWLPIWAKTEASRDGRPAIDKYLVKYDQEKGDSFNKRAELTSYHNLFASIMDEYTGVFSRATFGQELPDSVKQYADNFDNCGHSIQHMRNLWFQEFELYGIIRGKVDAPDEQADTVADANARGLRPYAVTVSQPHVINWQTDKFGRETLVVEDTGEKTEDGKQIYIRYTLDETVMFYQEKEDKDGKTTEVVIDSWPNELVDDKGNKILPWAYSGKKESKTWKGFWLSPMQGIADVAIELYNHSSGIFNQTVKTMFQFLAGPDIKIAALGMAQYFKVPKDEQFPQWIAPDSTSFEVMFKREDQLIQRMYQLAGIKNKNADTQAASANSAAQVIVEDKTAEDRVKMIADAVMQFELQMWKLYCYRAGAPQDAQNIVLTYPEGYDTETLNEALARLEAAAKLRNRELYLYEFAKMATAKISDPVIRDKVIKASENALNLRMEELGPMADIKMLLDIGVISVVELGKDISTALESLDDEKAAKQIQKNASDNALLIGNTAGFNGVLDEEDEPLDI